MARKAAIPEQLVEMEELESQSREELSCVLDSTALVLSGPLESGESSARVGEWVVR